MRITMLEPTKVDVKTLEIYCKVSDRFTYTLKDAQGKEVHSQDDGYVPDFMPGYHYGDYVILNIDIETGLVTNWAVPTAEQLEAAIKPNDD